MVEILTGAGGWEYFNVPGDRLHNYARAFRTVEVNSTFYTIPLLSLVESWRRRVLKKTRKGVKQLKLTIVTP